jgi:hypothetical protein
LSKIQGVLLIWLSAALIVGPVCYFALVYLDGNEHSVALTRSIIITVTTAFISTWLRFPKTRD